MKSEWKSAAFALLLLLSPRWDGAFAQQVTGQDLETILERADKLLEEAKAAYEEARSKASVPTFVKAGFKLEEARIKYLVLQEIGSADKQKLAADRLRAVNQLSKLVHDGKVAITGGASDSPALKPSDTPPAPSSKDPAPDPAPPAADPGVDVSKRAPIPDAAKQRDAEKLVKELFKEQYSKKTPADRKVLIRLLMDQAAKSQDDPTALWVLYREAQDNAVQICDGASALESIERMARIFDVDAMSMKNAALIAAGKTAKTPEELVALANALHALIEELIRADLYDSADKAAGLAVQHARKSNDPAAVARASTRAKEVAEAKALYQSMKSVMQTQAKNPDDPVANLEIGRFLCYVKGSWDLGLSFIVKGSDQPLKALAEKELAFPMQAAECAALADGWYDLAEKERSPLRKSQLYAHAKAIYGSALPDATGLLRAKIEKRLGEMKGAGGPVGKLAGIDLLKMVDPEKDTLCGTCTKTAQGLLCSKGTNAYGGAMVQIPYAPPDEYDLQVVLEKKDVMGKNPGGVIGLRDFAISLDIHDGNTSGLETLDGSGSDANETTYKGALFKIGTSSTVLCQLRKGRVTVDVDGKQIINWSGDFKRLSHIPDRKKPLPRGMVVGCWDSAFTIIKVALIPLGQAGEKLR